MSKKLKWVGTILLLIGVTMNILNNPELQQYIYPYNLIINTAGSFSLLTCSILEKDKPYILLNVVLGSLYFLGTINAYYPIYSSVS